MAAQRVTIATVAQRAGRSISTVSAALNGAPGVSPTTRESILRAAAELGYTADPRARLLRARHTGVIGVSYVAGQAFQLELVDGLYRAAEISGHRLSLAAATRRHSEGSGLDGLVHDRSEGVVVVDTRLPFEELHERTGGLPLIVLCREPPAPGVDAVRSDDAAGVRALVTHLVTSGRSDVVHVDGGDASCSELRAGAFRLAMAERGLPGRVVPGGEDEASGIAAVRDLAERGPLPQVLALYNDHAALGALLELRRRGVRVPEDVALTGFDGIPVTGLSAVDLTTVRQRLDVIAEVAMNRMLGRIGCDPERDEPPLPEGVAREPGEAGAEVFTVVPELVVRGSTVPTGSSA